MTNMMLYIIGMTFTAGLLMVGCDKDSWKEALLACLFALIWPLVLGVLVGHYLDEKEKEDKK